MRKDGLGLPARTAVLCLAVLAAPIAHAQPIRVLLVMPSDGGRFPSQVARFQDALGQSTNLIVRAPSLADADAIVEFTRYQRLVNERGEMEDRWYGEYKLLKVPVDRAKSSTSSPELFGLFVYGHEEGQAPPPVELLGRTLAKALHIEVPDIRSGA